ncbi:syntaxin of plants SYP7 [Pelomyxa schiedti]|nr:syntaxin of plants SYP7 [Pelomyxa schiedti]
MGSLDSLLGRLEVIYLETAEKKAPESDKKDEKVDPFTTNRLAIAEEIRELKKLIVDRDQVAGENPSSVEAVRMSATIRTQLVELEKHIQMLKGGHDKAVARYEKKKASKGKPDLELEDKFQLRGEAIQCAMDNLEECRNMERKRLGGPAFIPGRNAAAPTSLPNIDDPRFQELKRRDEEIDTVLDSIGNKVHALHGIAIEMNEVAHKQSDQIDKIADNVDDLNQQLISANKQMKEILEKLRSPDKFILDFILICVLLGVAGMVYTVIKDRI